jgi:hypothetical protein
VATWVDGFAAGGGVCVAAFVALLLVWVWADELRKNLAAWRQCRKDYGRWA